MPVWNCLRPHTQLRLYFPIFTESPQRRLIDYNHGSCCCSCGRGHHIAHRCRLHAAVLASEEWYLALLPSHIVPAG